RRLSDPPGSECAWPRAHRCRIGRTRMRQREPRDRQEAHDEASWSILRRLESRNGVTGKSRGSLSSEPRSDKLTPGGTNRWLGGEPIVNRARWLGNGSSVASSPILAFLLILSPLLLCGVRDASAQERRTWELTPMVGWQYGGTVDRGTGDLHMNAGWNF